MKENNNFDTKFKYLKFSKIENRYSVCLIDKKGYEIVRGFGNTKIEAINDLHSCLI